MHPARNSKFSGRVGKPFVAADGRARLADESGVALVEVIVSAVLMIVIAVSVFGALQSTGRAGAQERHRARAYAIAQADQARLRSLNVSTVSHLTQTRTETQDGITYSVASSGVPKVDRSTTTSCVSGNSSSDFVAVKSTVTWASMGTRPPVVIESIVTPPNGSLDANRGAISISVLDSRNNPYPGITVNGSGPSPFSGVTTSTGCLIFGDLLAGAYTVTPALANLVDKDGLPPGGVTTSVVGQSANSLGLQYDRPGTVNVAFTTIKAGVLASSTAERIRVFNTGMTQSVGFGTQGSRVSSIAATPLFPFTSPDTIWAGSCDVNRPGGGPALGSATIPVAAAAPTVTLQLPALDLTVYKGKKAKAGEAAAGATVKVTDRDCIINGAPLTRTYTTNSSGMLSDPGLPWGQYDICASGLSTKNTVEAISEVDFSVKNTVSALDLLLEKGNPGTCP